MKIKINIPGFGERYCSDNSELYLHDDYYIYYKIKTSIRHNECGPAWEHRNGSYEYFVNYNYHRLEGPAFHFRISWSKSMKVQNRYYVIGKPLGQTKEDFIKNLANVLIPKDKNLL